MRRTGWKGADRRMGRCVTVLLISLIYVPLTCAGQDTVKDYAKFCYGELGIKETNLPDSFACSNGKRLTTFLEGKKLEELKADDANRDGMYALKKCDTPAWLPSGAPGPVLHQCYAASYIQSITIANNDEFLGALLCRHKIRDSDRQDDFDDIAMILHNQKTGKTCWFNTKQGDLGGGVIAKVDGRTIPAPHKDAGGYWDKPSIIGGRGDGAAGTGGGECAACHDNGPWINSQWLHSQSASLTPTTALGTPFRKWPGNKYITPEYDAGGGVKPFKSWPKTVDFVTVAKETLLDGTDGTLTDGEKEAQKKLVTCTQCHKLTAKIGTWPHFGTNRSWAFWLNYTTGFAKPSQAGTDKADEYAYTHWMPIKKKETDRPPDAASFNKLYAKYLTELFTCMGTKRADRTAPCGTRTLALNSAPAGIGASLTAAVLAGQRYNAPAVPLADAPIPEPVPVPPGTRLQLGWQADQNFEACTIEATMPPGVLVPSSGGSGPPSVGTGSNWALPETPPVVGPLDVPGIYDFSMYCRDTYTASLQFEISGQPPTLLRLTTMVNDDVDATAHDSISSPLGCTTTNVRSSLDSVQLIWRAYAVQPDSCVLTGPGVELNGEVGSTLIEFDGDEDQIFTLTCDGLDGVSHSVASVLHPTTGQSQRDSGEK